MTGPNTGTGGLDVPPPKPENRKNIMQLAENAVLAKFQDSRYNEAELLRELQKKEPTDLLGKTREKMLGMFVDNPSEYEGFREQDIQDKISNTAILNMYRRILASLKSEQDKLKKRVIGMFDKSVFVQTTRQGTENLNQLEDWVSKQNEYDILHLLKSRYLLEKKLRIDVFGNKLDDMRRSDTPDMDLFRHIHVDPKNLTEKQRDACRKLGSQSEYFDANDARIFIDIIRDSHASIHDKRNAIKELLGDHFSDGINMEEAVRLGFIDQKEAIRLSKKQLAKWMGDVGYFDVADEELKRERADWAERACFDAKMTMYDVADIIAREEYLDTFLKTDIHNRPNILEKAIASKVENMKAESIRESTDIEGKGPNDVLSFIKAVNAKKDNEANLKIKNIGNIATGSILRFNLDDNTSVYLQIEQLDKELAGVHGMHIVGGEKVPINPKGISVINITRDEGVAPAGVGPKKEYSYSKLLNYIEGNGVKDGEVITAEEMERRRAETNEEGIKTIYTPEEDELDTLEKLDSVLGFMPEKDMVLSLEIDKNKKDYIRIKSIDSNTKTIEVSDGVSTYQFTYNQLAVLWTDLKGRFVRKIDGVSAFQDVLKGMSGYENVIVEGGALYRVTQEGGEEVKTQIKHLKNGAGEVIEIDSIDDTGVHYRYGKAKEDTEEEKDSKKKAKNPKIKGLKGSPQKSEFVQFLNFVESTNEGFATYIPDSDEVEDIEPKHAHLHGYAFARFMSGTSISDMVKGFDIYKHAWEHKLEKNSKFNSAKFANKYLSNLMPESFRGQLTSEMYAVQDGAMNDILKMLEETMNGKEARIYIRKKILMNSDARFEEVLAGMLYMAKKTGQLYSEELSDLKNDRLWFHQLARTMGYNTAGSRQKLWNDAAAKSPKGSLAVETDVIERVLKLWEGKQYRIPPNIAPKFAGMLSEGIKDQEDKGTKEVNMLSNVDQMNDYALSKLNVGEGYKAFGTLDRIYDKNGSAVQINTIPFTMVMSNVPEYLGTEFGKRLHGQAVGEQIRTSHALAFGNDINQVKKYRNMVWEAAKELERRGKPQALAELKHIEHERAHVGIASHGDKDTEDVQKKFVNSIFAYWKKHGEDLHPILQMTDPYIKTHTDKPVCREYASRISMITGMQRRRDNVAKTQQFGEGNWKYDHTPPMDFKNLIYASVGSINTHNMSMSSDMYEQGFVPGVLGALNKLRSLNVDNFPELMSLSKAAQDSELRRIKKSIFREYYISIIYYFRTVITNKAYFTDRAKSSNYIRMLALHGITLTDLDFGVARGTKPADIMDGEDEKSERNAEELDSYDASRIETLFEQFLSATPTMKKGVYARVNTTQDRVIKGLDREPDLAIDPDQYGS